jgi:hypothetical protein
MHFGRCEQLHRSLAFDKLRVRMTIRMSYCWGA